MQKYTLGDKIRIIRSIRGYVESYVAAKLGVSQQTYSRWERSREDFSEEALHDIAKILDVSVSFIKHFQPGILLTDKLQEHGFAAILSTETSIATDEKDKTIRLLKAQNEQLEDHIDHQNGHIAGLRKQNKTLNEANLKQREIICGQNEIIKDQQRMLNEKLRGGVKSVN